MPSATSMRWQKRLATFAETTGRFDDSLRSSQFLQLAENFADDRPVVATRRAAEFHRSPARTASAIARIVNGIAKRKARLAPGSFTFADRKTLAATRGRPAACWGRALGASTVFVVGGPTRRSRLWFRFSRHHSLLGLHAHCKPERALTEEKDEWGDGPLVPNGWSSCERGSLSYFGGTLVAEVRQGHLRFINGLPSVGIIQGAFNSQISCLISHSTARPTGHFLIGSHLILPCSTFMQQFPVVDLAEHRHRHCKVTRLLPAAQQRTVLAVPGLP
jgi:hypothetical protein